MKVQILSKKIIRPSVPTPHHLKACRLSFYDQLAPQYRVPLIYFYSINDQRQQQAKILEQLENSLSEILCRFYPFAGRAAEDGHSIDCGDQGVEYFEAQVDAKLDEFVEKAANDVSLVNNLAPSDLETHSPTKPLLAIRVTFFKCGGLALTVRISHIIADGYTSGTFSCEWAKASRLGINKVISPNFHFGSIFQGTSNLLELLKPRPPLKLRSDGKAKVFPFDRAVLSALKSEVMATAKAAGMQDFYPSRVQVVIATMWKALIRVAQLKHGHLRPSLLTMTLNLRGRTFLVPKNNACGNIYFEVPIKFMPKKEKVELLDLVSLVRDKVGQVNTDCAKATNGDEIIAMSVKLVNEMREEMWNDQVDVCVSTSVCKFPLYEADFGWGKPVWISVVCAPFDMFALMDNRDGKGIDVFVQLNEKDMQEFERDQDINKFTSSVKARPLCDSQSCNVLPSKI